MESILTYIIFAALVLAIAIPYWRKTLKQKKEAERSRKKSEQAGFHEPATLHPRIDLLTCIGCASCVQVCPEDVLGIVNGRASVVHGMRCVGHALCAEVCPVGAITMGFGKPKQGMEIPFYDKHFMTNIEGLYIIGELGGVGLIKNAFEQSKKAVEHISQKYVHQSDSTLEQPSKVTHSPHNNPNGSKAPIVYDIAIVGAGPAGLGAALVAQTEGLNHIVLEQYDLGGSVLHYPREKLVLTSPVELPSYGKIKLSEISKEDLLLLFNEIVERFKLNILVNKKVETISKGNDYFVIDASGTKFFASNVVLALGRRGSPRKLGVPGEELPKVYYRLIEAEKYQGKNLLIVGGGDSAIEAAIALARQKQNTVTLSYRRDSFVRLKEKNEVRINEMIKSGKVNVLFNSEIVEIKKETVTIKSGSTTQVILNDTVFIFAGGELPADFLRSMGVKLREQDVVD